MFCDVIKIDPESLTILRAQTYVIHYEPHPQVSDRGIVPGNVHTQRTAGEMQCQRCAYLCLTFGTEKPSFGLGVD